MQHPSFKQTQLSMRSKEKRVSTHSGMSKTHSNACKRMRNAENAKKRTLECLKRISTLLTHAQYKKRKKNAFLRRLNTFNAFKRQRVENAF